jgi:hypothetical protein
MQWRQVRSDVMHRATPLPFLPQTGTHHRATVILSWSKSGMNNQTSPKRNPSFSETSLGPAAVLQAAAGIDPQPLGGAGLQARAQQLVSAPPALRARDTQLASVVSLIPLQR